MLKQGCFMGVKQQVIYETIEAFRSGEVSRAKAAELLELSQRTVSRLARKVAKSGMAATVHCNKGKLPFNKTSTETVERILDLLKNRYYDFSLAHAHEKIRHEHHIKISYRTLVNLAHRAALRTPKTRRPAQARLRRERFANEGMLLQMDGSHHKWNGTDEWCMIAIIDDATSKLVYAKFEKGETTWACLNALKALVSKRGAPHFIYADKAGWANQSSPKRNHFSQFVRACEELGIKVIQANSPQAKGRIERANKTIQDRIVPEFRLNNITSMLNANQYMEQIFMPEWEKRFTVAASSQESRYRVVPEGVSLENIFCYKHPRTVASDNCVHFNGKNLQLLPGAYGTLKKKVISVNEYEDGSFSLYYGPLKLNYREFFRRGVRRFAA